MKQPVGVAGDDHSFRRKGRRSRSTVLQPLRETALILSCRSRRSEGYGSRPSLYCICAGQDMRKSGPDLTPGKGVARTAREERLAKALRENLRRRKEQRAQQRQDA